MMDRTVAAPAPKEKPKKRGAGASALAYVVFIILTLGYIGATYWLYTKMEEYRISFEKTADDLQNARNDLKKQKDSYDKLFADILDYADENSLRAALKVVEAEGEKKVEKELKVKEMLESLRAKVAELGDKVRTTEAELQSAKEDRDRETVQRKTHEEEKKKEVDDLWDKLKQAQEEIDKQKAEFEAKVNEANQQKIDTEKKLTSAEESWDEERKKYELEVQILKAKMAQLVGTREAKEELPPEVGRVVQMNLAEQFAIIDLGQDKNMKPKTYVEIYSQENDKVKKARAVVTKVHEKVSEVRLIDHDFRMPVAIGDVVRSYISGKGGETFVVAGKFGKDILYTKSEIEKLIERRGGKVMKDVDVDTNYLVLGDTTSDPSDKEIQEGLKQKDFATRFNVNIIKVDRLLEYIR